MHDVKGPGFVRFLYNHNPFYLISAAVILYGFRSATLEASFASNPWFLAILFAGYTTLLAMTAWVIVRFGRVWDDARSIFMVLLLLFMALSASLDGLFTTNPGNAITLATAGFIFAVVVTEALVWSLGIRFRALFRGPLYAMFAISFFYPYLFSIQQSMWPQLDSRFLILLFPFVVSATILALIPAIRRTRTYAAKNGTPWKWPLYPYSIFFLAIVGLVGRTVMLGLSFDPTHANGMLGTWMFVPIFLSVTWILFEIGTIERNRELQLMSMLLTPLSLALAVAWPIFSNTTFYDQITAEIASPVWLTMLAIVTIYFMAWIDNVEYAGAFLTLSLVGATLLQPNGAVTNEFSNLQSWPLLILAAWSVGSPQRVFRCSAWFLSFCCLSIPVANVVTSWLVEFTRPSGMFVDGEAMTAANFIIVASCLLVCIFSGQFAKQLRVCLAFLAATLAILVAVTSLVQSEHAGMAAVYNCVLASLGIAIFLFTKSRLNLSAAAVSMGSGMLAAFPLIEFSVGNRNTRLASYIAAGLACFLLGLIVSAMKAGWTRKLGSSFEKLKTEFREAFPRLEETVPSEHSTGQAS